MRSRPLAFPPVTPHMLAASPKMYNALLRLAGIAENISNARHAGIKPSDKDWSELYAAVNLANAVLLEAEGFDE